MTDSNELLAHVLIVDDDESFLAQAVEVFRQEGCACDCIRTIPEASTVLAESPCDLLVIETNIEGNRGLEFLEAQARLHGCLGAIVVTRYPSLETAVKAIRLSAIDYLVKPLDAGSFTKSVRCALEQCQAIRAMRRARRELVDRFEQVVLEAGNSRHSANSLGRPEWYLAEAACQFADLSISIMNTVQSLASGVRVRSHNDSNSVWNSDACRLMNCPRLIAIESEVRDAIEVLVRTKSAFKSKELAELRKRLTQVLYGDKSRGAERPLDGKPEHGSV